MKLTKTTLQVLIKEELLNLKHKNSTLSEGIKWHINELVPFDNAVFRTGTEKYFDLIREAKSLYIQGLYTPQTEFEKDMLESNLGEWGYYEGKLVPLDFPIQEGVVLEAKYKGKNVELGSPKRGSDGKAYVYVRDPKTGNVKKVSFGSSMPDAMGDSETARKRRKSFGERHNCADKKDRTKPGYWACRATKFFGRNISGWW